MLDLTLRANASAEAMTCLRLVPLHCAFRSEEIRGNHKTNRVQADEECVPMTFGTQRNIMILFVKTLLLRD